MKITFIEIGIIGLFCLVTQEGWGSPLSEVEMYGTELLDQKVEGTQLHDEASVTIVKVRTGEAFTVGVPGLYWSYKGPAELILLKKWYGWRDTCFEFKVDKWPEGDQFMLTFERFWGWNVRKFLIVREDSELTSEEWDHPKNKLKIR